MKWIHFQEVGSKSWLTASARYSSSSNKKWTGRYYLKSRTFSTVRKPQVHDIGEMRLVVLFQRTQSQRTAVIGVITKHIQSLDCTLLYWWERKNLPLKQTLLALVNVVSLLRLFSPGLVYAFPQSVNGKWPLHSPFLWSGEWQLTNVNKNRMPKTMFP